MTSKYRSVADHLTNLNTMFRERSPVVFRHIRSRHMDGYVFVVARIITMKQIATKVHLTRNTAIRTKSE